MYASCNLAITAKVQNATTSNAFDGAPLVQPPHLERDAISREGICPQASQNVRSIASKRLVIFFSIVSYFVVINFDAFTP